MLRNRILLIVAAVLFSTGGAAVKAVSLTGWQVASFRSLIAALVLLIALPEARRNWNWRMIPVAAAYAATLITFVLATRLTTAANAIFLQSTAPLYLLLLAPWLLKEPVRRSDVLYILVVAAGMLLFFAGTEAPLATAPDPARGKIIAAVSGFTFALMLAGFRWVGRGKEGNCALGTVVLGNAFAFLGALPMALPIATLGSTNLWILLYLGVFQIGVAYICVTRAMRHIPALEANTVLLLEPALNPVWVWIVHAERPGPWALAGGGLILSATLWNTWRNRN